MKKQNVVQNIIQSIIKEKVIGIPRALTFYNYFPFLYGFLTISGLK